MAVPNKMEQFTRQTTSAAMLPPGWEVAYNSSNVQYYIDHNTKKTYWQLPEEILHPPPLPEYDSDEETTASSVMSFLSSKSLGGVASATSFRREGLLVTGMKSIGQSVKNMFGKHPKSERTNGILEMHGIDELESGGAALDHSLFQQHGSDEDVKESTTPSSPPLSGRSILTRQLPNSNESINLSLRSIHHSSDADEEMNLETSSVITDLLTKGDTAEVDSVSEFPVLKLAELSPTSTSELPLRSVASEVKSLVPDLPVTNENYRSRLTKHIENDVLAFVYGLENRSLCSDNTPRDPYNTPRDLDNSPRDPEPPALNSVPVGKTPSPASSFKRKKSVTIAEPVAPGRVSSKKSMDESNLTPRSVLKKSNTREPDTFTFTTAEIAVSTPPSKDNNNLPTGWEMCHTPRGKLFYINHNDRTTHWSLPQQDDTYHP